jgi:AAA family ATP:ADP antiporter
LVQYLSSGDHNQKEREARSTLINLLETRLDRQLERIFNFLGLKYPPEDVGPIYNSLTTGKKEQRLHAIEFLDNMLDPQLKRELLPLIESATLDPSSESRVKQLGIPTFSDIQCFSLLLQRPDVKLKLAVLFLMAQIKDKKYLPVLDNCLLDHNQKVRDMAETAINDIKNITSA